MEPPDLPASRGRATAALCAVALTSLLLWFGNGLNPWWPLMWFAPLPVLLFAAGSRSWLASALVAGSSWLLGSLSLWHYFTVLRASVAWVVIFTTVSVVFAGAVLLFRALLRRDAPWSALLAFPAAYVCCEYTASVFTPGGTAGNLAYTQLRFLPFLQLASLAGPSALSFLLLLFPAALAIGWHRHRVEPRQARRILGVSLGALALILAFGTVRLNLPTGVPTIKVGLIASDEPANVDPTDPGRETTRLLQAYADEAAKLAARGAEVIVLPEKIGVVADQDLSTSDAIFQAVADRTGATVVAGLIRLTPPSRSNQARVYAPGAPVASYDKQHLLPAPFESRFTPGTALTLLSKAPAPWGVAICKDLDFTRPARQYGQADTGLLLVPAWDFNLDRVWHGHIARMRGVEGGFCVVRVAKQGNLFVSDDRGRVLAESRSDAGPFATLLAEVPTTHVTTFYERLGDWWAWLAVAILVFTLGRLLWLLRGRTSLAKLRIV